MKKNLVLRGGAWISGAVLCRSAFRDSWSDPGHRYRYLGFRFAKRNTGNEYLVLRGGSWLSVAELCRSAYRRRYGPGYRDDLLGFRLARNKKSNYVYRGGSWHRGAEDCRSAFRRYWLDSGDRRRYLGFRLARRNIGNEYLVLRGGAWSLDAEYCRSAFRDYWLPGRRGYDLGFRLARRHR